MRNFVVTGVPFFCLTWLNAEIQNGSLDSMNLTGTVALSCADFLPRSRPTPNLYLQLSRTGVLCPTRMEYSFRRFRMSRRIVCDRWTERIVDSGRTILIN